MFTAPDEPTLPTPPGAERQPYLPLLRPTDAETTILRQGLEVFGRYELKRLVGRGGMGMVWLTEDRRLNRPVALKFLPEVFFLDAAARDSLKRETRRSLDLTHPHIVRIHDFVEDEHMAAIAMEYVDGPTLSDLRVEQTSRYFEPDGLSMWTGALCAALEYAHGPGRCVHRDLKPNNLMVNSRGVLKVADFGIACNLHNTAARVSAWSSTGGTLGYMSPQQLLGELASPADDIYSVGATLYELLTGQPPFFSGDVALQIREVVPDKVSLRRSKFGLPAAPLPKVWDETIAACLAKAPRDRPASAGEIARSLGLDAGPVAEIAPPLINRQAATVCSAPTEVVRLTAWDRGLIRARKWVRPLAPAMRSLAPYRWPIITATAVILTAWISQMGDDTPLQPPRPAATALMPSLALPAATQEAPAPNSATPVQTNPTPLPALPIAQATPVPGLPQTGDQLALSAPIPTPARQWTESAPAAPAAAPAVATGLPLNTIPDRIPFTVSATSDNRLEPEVLRSGETPDTLNGLPPGTYRLVLRPAGLPVLTAEIVIPEAGTPTPFHQEFPHGVVKVRSQPDGATVIVDDEEIGEAPLEVPLLPGKHEIGARVGDREARIRIVEIKNSGEQSVVFDFRTGSKTTAAKSRPRRPKKEDTVFTKVGRSIKTFFSGDKKR